MLRGVLLGTEARLLGHLTAIFLEYPGCARLRPGSDSRQSQPPVQRRKLRHRPEEETEGWGRQSPPHCPEEETEGLGVREPLKAHVAPDTSWRTGGHSFWALRVPRGLSRGSFAREGPEPAPSVTSRSSNDPGLWGCDLSLSLGKLSQTSLLFPGVAHSAPRKGPLFLVDNLKVGLF